MHELFGLLMWPDLLSSRWLSRHLLSFYDPQNCTKPEYCTKKLLMETPELGKPS